MKKNKKRKLSGPEEAEIPPKPQRIALSENRREQTDVERAEELEQRDPNQELIEEGSPWRNLQLILSLQKKELDLPKFVLPLVFLYVAVCLVYENWETKET